MKIYLCGPINGCTDEDCKDWRKAASERFHDTLDPMRRDYRGKEAECYREIVELDKRDIQVCDALLVNFPQASVGTSMEILLAWQMGKPIALVAGPKAPMSPWLIYHATRIFTNFESAYRWLQSL